MSSRYQIIGEINQGGVGVVLKAWDTKLQRNVAIKRFLSMDQRLALGNVDGDLLKEASTLSSMHHPNIVSVYDVNMEAEAGPEVIMEYLNGQDLEQAIAQAALTLEDFYQVAQQTLDALSNAHRMNLLHRDIKPSNIQVTWLANGKFVSKFVDFGLAKFFEKPSKQTVRQDGTVLGSIYYMAPEQFERKALDRRSDIYSLGCVFYFALTMHRPFEGQTVMDVITAHLRGRPVRVRDYRPAVPRHLEKWVEWLMHLRPEGRPDDAEIALDALRKIMAGQTPENVPGIQSSSQPVSLASQPVTTATRMTDVVLVPEKTHPFAPIPVPAVTQPAAPPVVTQPAAPPAVTQPAAPPAMPPAPAPVYVAVQTPAQVYVPVHAPAPVQHAVQHPQHVHVHTPVMRPAPAIRTRQPAHGPAAKRKNQKNAGRQWLYGGTAAAVILASMLIIFRSGRNRDDGLTRKPPTAMDILDAAKREAELHKTKTELAVANARLAVAQSSPAVSALPVVTRSRDFTQPPPEGLIMWFDAGNGTRANAAGVPAVVNGPAAQWVDSAPAGGVAVMQYTASNTPGKELNFPTVRLIPAGAGLAAARHAVSFDGTGDTLCVRDRDKTGEKIEATLDGCQTSVLMVYRATGPDAPEGLLLARDDKKKTMWSLGVKNNGLVCGPGSAAPLIISGTESEFRIASLTLDAAAGMAHLSLLTADGRKASADPRVKLDSTAHLEMLRMGTSDGTTSRNRSAFAGDVAEILIYNRSLDSASLLHAETYLRSKYFGTGAAVMANAR